MGEAGGNGHEHATRLVEGHQFAVGTFPVQIGGPVGTFVLLHQAAGAFRGTQVFVAGGLGEGCIFFCGVSRESHQLMGRQAGGQTVATVDGVDVMGEGSGSVDGVDPLHGQTLGTGQAPEGTRLQGKDGKRQEDAPTHHHDGLYMFIWIYVLKYCGRYEAVVGDAADNVLVGDDRKDVGDDDDDAIDDAVIDAAIAGVKHRERRHRCRCRCSRGGPFEQRSSNCGLFVVEG